jgi:RimJ/RimL family protein N-acetyltransferase
MPVAWRLYEKLGFERSKDLDFSQDGLPVFGFRLWLH